MIHMDKSIAIINVGLTDSFLDIAQARQIVNLIRQFTL